MQYAFVLVNKVNKNYDDRCTEDYYSKSADKHRQSHDMYLDKSVKIISLFDMDEFNLKEQVTNGTKLSFLIRNSRKVARQY